MAGIESARPTIVCLCGSTRFWRTFQTESLRLTLEGKIVLSIGAAKGADDDDKSFGGYIPAGKYDEQKKKLDELHLRKIDLADEVLILNRDGYIGESTSREIRYAFNRGKKVNFREPPLTDWKKYSELDPVYRGPQGKTRNELVDDGKLPCVRGRDQDVAEMGLDECRLCRGCNRYIGLDGQPTEEAWEYFGEACIRPELGGVGPITEEPEEPVEKVQEKICPLIEGKCRGEECEWWSEVIGTDWQATGCALHNLQFMLSILYDQ